MVNVSSDTVKRFKEMFKREYGIEYSDKEAWEATYNLLGVFDLLMKEDRKQHPENYTNKRNGKKSNTCKCG